MLLNWYPTFLLRKKQARQPYLFWAKNYMRCESSCHDWCFNFVRERPAPEARRRNLWCSSGPAEKLSRSYRPSARGSTYDWQNWLSIIFVYFGLVQIGPKGAAIFYAICLAIFKSLALQLHEQGCYTVQWECQQLAKLRPRRTEERIIRILIGWLSKALWGKLLEGCYTVQRRLKVAAIVAESRTEFYFVQCCAKQKCCETSCRGNLVHRSILQQLVSQRRWGTSCWENCTV